MLKCLKNADWKKTDHKTDQKCRKLHKTGRNPEAGRLCHLRVEDALHTHQGSR